MKYVLITGGTSGIGLELARKFAAERYGIVIAASNKDKLHKVKEQLSSQYAVPVHVYALDLGAVGGAKALYEKVKKDSIQIDILVNNAGIGVIGAAETIAYAKDEQMMILNMITPAELCKLFLKDMYQRGNGRILNIASTGAFQPGPYTASYYASKSFLLSYSRAVRREAKAHGVCICTLCPGTTRTEFFRRAHSRTPEYAMSPQKVAEYGYQSLMRGKEVAVPGILNKLLRAVPAGIKIFFVEKIKSRG